LTPLDPIRMLAASAAPTGAAGGSSIAPMLIVAGVVLLTIWAVASLRRRLAARGGESPSERVRARMEGLRERQSAQREVDSYAADAEELTRRLAAHLDNKAARIEELIAEATRAGDRLAALLEQSQARGASEQSSQRLPQRPQDERRPSWVASEAAEDEHPEPRSPTDPVKRRVYELADEGLPPVEIARELEEHIGKVELILALRSA